MGMYDQIICRADLPDRPEAFKSLDHRFQTKDFACQMNLFEITDDGRLKQTEDMFGAIEHEFFDHTGELNFGSSNWSACAYGITFTRSGEDHEDVDYRAIFVKGKLTEVIQTQYKREPALSREIYASLDAKFEADAPQINLTPPKIGDEMFLQYGGSIKGFSVKLLAQTKKKWAFSDENDGIETIHPEFFGHLLFHSKEDSEAYNNFGKDMNEQKAEYCQQLLQAKNAEKETP